MATIRQPSFKPTNKLTAAMLGGAVYEFIRPGVARGIELAGESLGIAWSLGVNSDVVLQFGVMAILGYIVKDNPNVVPPEAP